MKSFKISLAIDTVVKLSVVSALIVAAAKTDVRRNYEN